MRARAYCRRRHSSRRPTRPAWRGRREPSHVRGERSSLNRRPERAELPERYSEQARPAFDPQFNLAAQVSRLQGILDKIQNGSLQKDADYLVLQYDTVKTSYDPSFAEAHPNAAALIADPASYQANLQAKLAQAMSQLNDLNNQIAQLQKQQVNCAKTRGRTSQNCRSSPTVMCPCRQRKP